MAAVGTTTAGTVKIKKHTEKIGKILKMGRRVSIATAGQLINGFVFIKEQSRKGNRVGAREGRV